MFTNERVRHHTIVGPLPIHREERHWTIGTILTAVSIAVAVAGAGVSAYAASEQAAAQKRAFKFQQKARENEAESARLSAAYEERQFRKRLAVLMGKQEAGLSATGLDPLAASPFMLQIDTVREGELEALNIRRTGALSASESELEARLTGLKIGMTEREGSYGMLASGLQGANSVLSSWSSSQGYNRRPTRWGAQTVQSSQIYSY